MRLSARLLVAVGVLLAVLAVRIVGASNAELARGDELRARDDVDAAILAYRRAARWYAPGNPSSTDALDRLAAIALAAHEAGDLETSLAAWRALRGAIRSTRSLWVPHPDRLSRAETQIAILMAERAGPTERAETQRRARSQLELPPRPHLIWTVLLLAGWLAWTLGAFAFASWALDEEDRPRGRQAQLWGTVVVLGFGIFVIGMALA